MTEEEWFGSTDPRAMLQSLSGKVSDRKYRYLACASCRRVWSCLAEGEIPAAIELIERLADGMATRREMAAVRSSQGGRGGYSALWAAENALSGLLNENAESSAVITLGNAGSFRYFHALEQNATSTFVESEFALAVAAQEYERRKQVHNVKDIFGNHYKGVTAISSWLTWNDGTIVRIAQAIYDERAFDRMPILADALEDAGCDNADLLRHCREPGEHVRGCWVIDLLLGKE